MTPKGSIIWNLIALNRYLIREHNFWEIRGGDIAQFWEESWQQQEKIFSEIDLGEIFLFTNRPNTKTIAQFLDEGTELQWRKWKLKDQWKNAPETCQWENYVKELKSRKLTIATREDILIWGYCTKCMFTIQEGHYIKSNNIHNVVVPLWKKNMVGKTMAENWILFVAT